MGCDVPGNLDPSRTAHTCHVVVSGWSCLETVETSFTYSRRLLPSKHGQITCREVWSPSKAQFSTPVTSLKLQYRHTPVCPSQFDGLKQLYTYIYIYTYKAGTKEYAYKKNSRPSFPYLFFFLQVKEVILPRAKLLQLHNLAPNGSTFTHLWSGTLVICAAK